MTFIPYGRHSIEQSDIDAVVNVLKTQNLTQGTMVTAFERSVAEFVGVKYAVAVSSATAGLHLAYKVLGVNENSEVIVPPITFVSTANACEYNQGKVIFCDVDLETGNLDTEQLTGLLTNNTKIITPVHYGGATCDMEQINKVARRAGVSIVEDAAHALGATYKCGAKVGSCKYSDITVFSFHPVKNIACGEGGMICTNNYSVYQKLRELRSHGIHTDPDRFEDKCLSDGPDGTNPWYYEMTQLGFHYRITDIQCALGLSQLNRLEKFIEKRRLLAKRYDTAFKNCANIKLINLDQRKNSGHHLYSILVDLKNLKFTKSELINSLKKHGIGSQVHYIPVYEHPYYRKKYGKIRLNNANNFYEQVLSIPFFYDLTLSQQDTVIRQICELVREK